MNNVFLKILIYSAKSKRYSTFYISPIQNLHPCRGTVLANDLETQFFLKTRNIPLFFARLLILKCSYLIKVNFQNIEIGKLNKMVISFFVFTDLEVI